MWSLYYYNYYSHTTIYYFSRVLFTMFMLNYLVGLSRTCMNNDKWSVAMKRYYVCTHKGTMTIVVWNLEYSDVPVVT